MTSSYEGELFEPDEEEASDDSFDLGFALANAAGSFSVERLKSGFRFFTDNVLAGDASDDIDGLMCLIGSKLGTVLDVDVDADAISEMIAESEPEQERPYLEDALRNKAVVRRRSLRRCTRQADDRRGRDSGAALDAAGMLQGLLSSLMGVPPPRWPSCRRRSTTTIARINVGRATGMADHRGQG